MILRQPRPRVVLSLTPLIDVVFILLIFFMLTLKRPNTVPPPPPSFSGAGD